MRNEISRLRYISTIFTILVCIFSFSLDKLIVSTIKNVNNIQSTIEESYKQEMKTSLLSLRSGLENAISNKIVNSNNDEDITKWVLDHIGLLNNTNIDKISLVNVGYSPEESNLDMSLILGDISLPNNIKTDILSYTEHINSIDKNISNNDMIDYINRLCDKIEMKYNDGDKIRDILLNKLFIKNKILFNTDYGNSITIKNDKFWTESIMIPDGPLGFNNEPVYKNNRENFEYRKIIITVIIDISEVMSPYDEHMINLGRLFNTANLLLITLSIGTIIFICVNFISILKKYNVGGDTNAEDNRSVCAYINSMLRVIGVRIKQIWNKFRKRN